MKIRNKILLTTVALIVLLGVLAALISRDLIYRELHYDLEVRGQSILRELAGYLANPLLVGDTITVQGIIDEACSSEHGIAYIFVVGFNGKVVAHTFKKGFPAELLAANPIPAGKQQSSQLLSTEKGRIRDFAIHPLEGMRAEIHLGLYKGEIDAAMRRITNIIIGLTILVVLLASLVIYFLGLLITRPLEKLSAMASKMSFWDLNQRVEVKSKDEIGELAESFNKMAKQLQDSYEEVGESEAKYRSLMKDAHDAIFVVTLEGKILDANLAGQKLTGFDGVELREMAIQQLIPESERDKNEQMLAKVTQGVTIRFETKALTKDKKVIDVEASASRITYGGHKVVLATVRDITERKQAEEEYKTIIGTTMDGFWIADMQGHFLDVNEAYGQLVGYSRDELLKMRISDVEAVEKPEETAERIRRIMKTGGDRFETQHRSKDGRIIDIEVSVDYMAVSGGRMFVFLRDITEHKRAEGRHLRKKRKPKEL